MIINKLIILVLAATISGCSTNSWKSLPFISQQKYKAWNKTYWGMPKSEVFKTFPQVVSMEQAKGWADYAYQGTNNEINKSCRQMRLSRPGDNCSALGMEKFQIVGKNHNVFFFFTNNQLSHIKLICEGDTLKTAVCFDNTEHLLIQKYGKPIEDKRKEISMGKSATLNTSIKK